MIGSRVAPEPCDISSYLDWVLKMMVSSPAINIFRYMNLVLGDSATMELNLTEIILDIFKQKGHGRHSTHEVQQRNTMLQFLDLELSFHANHLCWS